jgi:hypothetical protein
MRTLRSSSKASALTSNQAAPAPARRVSPHLRSSTRYCCDSGYGCCKPPGCCSHGCCNRWHVLCGAPFNGTMHVKTPLLLQQGVVHAPHAWYHQYHLSLVTSGCSLCTQLSMDMVEVHPDGSLRVEALAMRRHAHANRFTTKVGWHSRQRRLHSACSGTRRLCYCSAYSVHLQSYRGRAPNADNRCIGGRVACGIWCDVTSAAGITAAAASRQSAT